MPGCHGQEVLTRNLRTRRVWLDEFLRTHNKRKYDEVAEKVDAGIYVKTCVWLIDRCLITLPRGLYLYPALKNYNQTQLESEFQIKRNPYTKRTLTTIESIKLSSTTDWCTATSQSATSALIFRVVGRLPVIAISKHRHWSSARTHHHFWTWSYSVVSPSAPTFIGNSRVD